MKWLEEAVHALVVLIALKEQNRPSPSLSLFGEI
jgi:hypothetical protein